MDDRDCIGLRLARKAVAGLSARSRRRLFEAMADIEDVITEGFGPKTAAILTGKETEPDDGTA